MWMRFRKWQPVQGVMPAEIVTARLASQMSSANPAQSNHGSAFEFLRNAALDARIFSTTLPL